MKDRIIQLRKALRYTQGAFGEKIGLTASGVSNIENGIREIQERHILLILSAFPQVSEEWLRNGTGPMFIQDDNPVRQIMQRYNFPDIVKQFLVAYDRLTPDEQKVVYKYTTELVTAIVGSGEPGANDAHDANDANDAHETIGEIDIDAETEAYRQQLINQKKVESSRSTGTGDTDSVRA